MMRRIAMCVLGWVIGASATWAQLVVTLQLPFSSRMPSQISQWRENDALIRVVVQNTTRTSFRDVFISATLTRDGQPIAQTNDGHPSQPRLAIGPGETRSFSWREIISESALDYDRSVAQQVLTTGELPEGSYQLCLRALSAQRQPLSQQQCGSFQIILADPPVLLAPIRGALVSPTPLLQWTPSSPSVPGLVYRLTVKVRYAGQTPAQAMASNPVRIQHDVSTTSYQVPVTEQLLPDPLDPNYAGHVWQVQALYNGRPYGRNRGLSQIEWFVCVPNPGDTTYRSNEVKGYDATSRKPDTVRVPVLSWTVPYPELLTGRPVKLTGTVPAEDTLLYSLHLQMPERIGPDLVAVLVGKGSPSTEPLQVNGMKYRGGYFVYREPPKYRGGFFVYGAPSDTGKGGREPIPIEIVPLELRTYGTPSDTGAGGSVQRRYNYSGYYVYRLPSDTTQPAPLDTIVYYNSVASQIRRDTCCVDCIGLTGQTTIETRPEVSVGGTFVPLMLGLHLTDVVLVGDLGSEPVGGVAQDDQGSVLPGDPVRLWWAKRPGDTPQLLAVGAIHRDGVRFFWAGKRTLSPGSQVEVDVFPLLSPSTRNTALSLGAISPALPLFGIFDCDDECGPAGAVRNRRIEITYTPRGSSPGESERVIAWATFLTYLPRQSPGAGRIGREILRALPFLAMTRGFDVWVRVCCERCDDTPCWIFWSNREWVAHCSPWHRVLSVDGLINVGSGEGLNQWQPVSCDGRPCTWEDIRRRVVEAASRIPCP